MFSRCTFFPIHCLFDTESLTFPLPEHLRRGKLLMQGERLPIDEVSLPMDEHESSAPLMTGRGGGTGFFQPTTVGDLAGSSGFLVCLNESGLFSSFLLCSPHTGEVAPLESGFPTSSSVLTCCR